MATVDSSKIKVFPVGNRLESTDTQAAETTERNLTQMMKNAYNRDGFVISESKQNGNIEFVLQGYYFRINNDSYIKSTSNKNIYAHIGLIANAHGFAATVYNRLTDIADSQSLLDHDGKFTGLVLDGLAVGPEGTTHTLHLYQDSKVPVKSKLHWKTSEILDGDTNNYIKDKFTGVDANFSGTVSADILDGALVGGYSTDRTLAVEGDLTGSVTSKWNDENGTITLSATVVDDAITPAKLQYAYNHIEIGEVTDNKLVITITDTKSKAS